MADINVNVVLPDPISVDVTSPTQAIATNISVPGPQGPAGPKGFNPLINGISGDSILFSGRDGIIISSDQSINTIYVSGNSGYFESAINTLTNNLNLTGTNLNNSINNLSGLFTGYTGNLDNNYATDAQLASTGNILNNNINSLSGTLTSNYATITNLASTGSTLVSSINSLNSDFTGFTGNLDATYATDSQLATTGSTLNTRINNLSGYINSSSSNILFTTGNQIKSGRLIIGNDAGSIVDPNSEYTLSLQTNSPRTWLEILNNSGANKGVFFGIEGNDFEQYNWQAGDIKFFTSENFSDGTERLRIKNDGKVGIGTSSPSEKLEVVGNILANNLVYNTGNQIISGNKTFDLAPIVSGNPLITGNLSLYATTINLATTGSTLDNKINSLSGASVLTYGSQSISGIKTFSGQGVVVNFTSGASLLVSGVPVLTGIVGTGNFITLDQLNQSQRNIYISSNGNDSTAQIGNINRPYLTAQAAFNAAILDGSNQYILNFYAGNWTINTASTFNWPITLGVRGIGPTSSSTEAKPTLTITHSVVGSLANPGPNRTIVDFGYHSIILSIESRGGSYGGGLSMNGGAGGNITLYNAIGSTISSFGGPGGPGVGNVGGVGGNINLYNCEITTEIISEGGFNGNATIKAFGGNVYAESSRINSINVPYSISNPNPTNTITLIDCIYNPTTSLIKNITLRNSYEISAAKSTLSSSQNLTAGFLHDFSISNNNLSGILNNLTLHDNQIRPHLTGRNHALTIDFASGIYVNNSDIYGNLRFNNSIIFSGNDAFLNFTSGARLLISGNPVLTGVDLSSYATTANLASTGSTLTSNLASTGSTLNTKIDNLSGYVNSSNSNIVFTTGNQNISGIKTFANDINVLGTGSFNGINLDNINSLVLSGMNINITGNSILNIYNTVRISGNQVLTGVTQDSRAVLTTTNQFIEGRKIFEGTGVFTKLLNANKIYGIDATFDNFFFQPTAADDLVISGGKGTYGGKSADIYLVGGVSNSKVYLLNSTNITGDLNVSRDITAQRSGFFLSGIKIGSNSVIITDEFIKISGDPVIVQSAFTGYSGYVENTYAKISNLASTGSTLDSKINSLSGSSASAANLASTGSILDLKINNLSGYINTQATTISNNLNTTGSTLDNKINSLSGAAVLKYGDQTIDGIKTFRDKVYIHDLYVTGEEFIANVTNNYIESPYILLNLTGGAVDGGIFFVTGVGLTGVNDLGPIIGFDHTDKFKFGISSRGADLSTLNDIAAVQDITAYSGFVNGKYATIINLNSTGSTLDTKINTLSGYSNNTFSTITNLASTGSTLNTKIDNLSGHINSTNSNIVFTTGDQTISGNKTFANYLVFGNENGIGGSISGNYNGVDSNLYINGGGGAAFINLNTSSASIRLGEDGIYINPASEALTIDNTDVIYINGVGSAISAPDTTASFKDVNANNIYAQTGNFQKLYADNLVYNTGNQTINGLKTFTSGIDIYSGTSPQSIRVFNSTGTNSGEFGLFGWQNNNLIVGAQKTNSGIFRNLILTGNNFSVSESAAVFISGNNGGITFGARSAQNQISTISTDNNDILYIQAGLGAGKTIRIGDSSRYIDVNASRLYYQNSASSYFLLVPDAANNLSLRNGTNPNTFRVFNTTGTNSGEFGSFSWQNNNLLIGAQATSSGILRDVILTGNRVISTVPLIISGADLSGINTNGTQGFRLTSRALGLLGDSLQTVLVNEGYGGITQLGTDGNTTLRIQRGDNSSAVLPNNTSLGWHKPSPSNIAEVPDVRLWRDGSGILSLRSDNISRGTNFYITPSGMQFRVFNITGTNTGEFGLFGWQNSQLILGSQQSQSGTLRDIVITGNNININGAGVFNVFDNTNIVGNLNVTGNILLSGNQVLTGSSTLYATSANLASTGSTLDTKVNALSGSAVLLYGDQTINGTKTFTTRPTVNGTGVLLSGEAASLPTTIVYTTGNQNIGGNKTFTGVTTFSGQEVNLVDTALNLSGVGDMTFIGTNINFINSPVFISGTNLRVSGDVSAYNVYTTGQIGIGTSSPTEKLEVAGNIKFGDVANGYSAKFMMWDTPNGVYNTGEWADSQFILRNSIPNTYIALGFETITNYIESNGSILRLPSGKDDFIAMDREVVHKTGNETISGIKTFNSGVVINVQPTGTNPALVITGTWNNASQIYTGIRLNVTDTNSDTNSSLINLQVGGTSQFRVRKNGWTYIGTYLDMGGIGGIENISNTYTFYNNSISMNDGTAGLFFRNGNTRLFSDADNRIDFRNGLNPQQFRVYNSTGTNSGEFGLIGWTNNSLIIGPQQTNSGILRDLTLTGNNININASGVFNIFDNTNVVGNLTVSGNTTITGHLSAASKSFLINHPTQVGKKLQYGSLESPYHGIRLTDKNKISADSVQVNLPDYISALVNEDKVNVQLTNINHDKVLFVKEVNVNDNNFVVGINRGWFDKNEYEFYWSFTAERKDIPKLTVEF